MQPEPKPTTLSAEELKEFTAQLSKLRHDVNNHLTLIVSAGELLRRKPELAERMVATISEQCGKIEVALRGFSGEAGRVLKIQRN